MSGHLEDVEQETENGTEADSQEAGDFCAYFNNKSDVDFL